MDSHGESVRFSVFIKYIGMSDKPWTELESWGKCGFWVKDPEILFSVIMMRKIWIWVGSLRSLDVIHATDSGKKNLWDYFSQNLQQVTDKALDMSGKVGGLGRLKSREGTLNIKENYWSYWYNFLLLLLKICAKRFEYAKNRIQNTTMLLCYDTSNPMQ